MVVRVAADGPMTDPNPLAHLLFEAAHGRFPPADGAVEVQNQNGSISVAGLRGSCNAVTLHTTFASIKVAVPRNQGYTVEARTTFGSINTELPINVTRRSDEALTGTINGGGCKMELVNANGGVTITGE